MSIEKADNFKISFAFQNQILNLSFDAECKKGELASKIGISKDILIRATNVGMIPSPKSLIKIADYFDVSIEFLLGFTSNEIFIKSDDPVAFQMRLTELKERKQITSCATATELGFTRSLFATWKKYEYIPSLENLFSLSRFFKVSIDYLLGRTEYEDIV